MRSWFIIFPAVTQPIGNSQQIRSWSGVIWASVGWLLYQASPGEQINHREVAIRGCLHCDYAPCQISWSGFLNFLVLAFPTSNLRIKIFFWSKYKNWNKQMKTWLRWDARMAHLSVGLLISSLGHDLRVLRALHQAPCSLSLSQSHSLSLSNKLINWKTNQNMTAFNVISCFYLLPKHLFVH